MQTSLCQGSTAVYNVLNLCTSYGSVCISNIEQNSGCSILFAIFQIFINQRNSYMFLMVFRSQAVLVFLFYRQQRKTDNSSFIQDAGLKLNYGSVWQTFSLSLVLSPEFSGLSQWSFCVPSWVVYFLSPTSTAACIFSNKPFLHLVLLTYSSVKLTISTADNPIMI